MSSRTIRSPRSAATSTCSPARSARPSPSRRAPRCSRPSSASACSHARRASTPARPRARPCSRRSASSASASRASSCAAFSFYFLLVNLAEQHHRIRRLRLEAASGEHAARSARPRRSPRSAPPASRRTSCARAPPQVRLEPVLTAHPTEAARRTYLQSQLRLGRLLEWLDDPRAAPDERRAAERARRRGDDGALADRRGALDPPERRRRDPPGPVVLRGEPDRRLGRSRGAARRGAARARHAAAAVRHLDRRRPGWQSERRRPTRSATRSPAPARSRCAATATRCASSPRAIGVSDTLVQVDDELRASIARDERELPWVEAETAVRNEHEPYRRKLTAIWRRLDNELSGRDEPGYARAAELRPTSTCVDASLRHHLGARIADGRLAALRRARRGLRPARRAARRPRPRRPGARARRPAARDLSRRCARPSACTASRRSTRSCSRAPRAPQDVLAAQTLGGAGRLRPLRGAAVRDHRRPGARARDPRRAARAPAFAARLRARAPAHGDGRLLRLGQGRRLPRRAVGDPRGPRRARPGRRRARRSS